MKDPREAGVVCGTPGYISPEAARGAPPHPQMDVFAAALMLGEMLCGQRLNHDPDPWRTIQRVQSTDLLLPSGLAPDVDDGLRAIVQRKADQAQLLLRSHIEQSKAEVRSISLASLHEARQRHQRNRR